MNFKKTTVATVLLSSFFLVGCSSTSSNNSPSFDGDAGFENVDPGFGISIIPENDLPHTDPDFGNPETDPGFEGIAPTYADIIREGNIVMVHGDEDNKAFIRLENGYATVAINGDYNNHFYMAKNGVLYDQATEEQVGSYKVDNGQVVISTTNGNDIILRDEDGRLFIAIIEAGNPGFENIDPGFGTSGKPDNELPDDSDPDFEHPSDELDPDFENVDPDFGISGKPDNDLPDVDPDFGEQLPTYADIMERGGAIVINGDEGNNAIVRVEDGQAMIVINGDYNNLYVANNGVVYNHDTGEQFGTYAVDNGQVTISTINGNDVVLRNESGRLFIAIIEGGHPGFNHPTDDVGGGFEAPTHYKVEEINGQQVLLVSANGIGYIGIGLIEDDVFTSTHGDITGTIVERNPEYGNYPTLTVEVNGREVIVVGDGKGNITLLPPVQLNGLVTQATIQQRLANMSTEQRSKLKSRVQAAKARIAHQLKR
ncbi:hypothetical protein [Shewanella woodyi]|uniref:hypothetical protein n=1 Tax=Shewanella woodyi TaxID=60961 RepID=UPI0037484306